MCYKNNVPEFFLSIFGNVEKSQKVKIQGMQRQIQ